MKKLSLIVLAAVAMMAAPAHADVVTQWNFNGDSALTVPGGSASPTPSLGVGTASLLGTTASFSSGIANGGSSDPVTTSPPNYGWQTTGYAAQGIENNERGIQFFVSTIGFTSITLNYDLRHSNTSSRFERVLYTVDGGSNWVDGVFVFDGPSGDTWFNGRTVDLSSIGAVENNANFGFRIVATFDDSIGGYAPSNSAGTYAGSGTWRFDMVTVNGTAIPEPGSLAVLSLIGAVAALRRRK